MCKRMQRLIIPAQHDGIAGGFGIGKELCFGDQCHDFLIARHAGRHRNICALIFNAGDDAFGAVPGNTHPVGPQGKAPAWQ